MDIDLLVKISARAWSLDILAHMHRGVPGRQARLLAVTGAGRTAFAQSLAHLIDLGLVERNPGHGHPLRPEYRLTAAGIAAAAMANRVMETRQKLPQADLLRRAWTLPVLAVSGRPRFFSQIKASLPPITDRALSQSLKSLQGLEWISREVLPDSHPPRALYRAVNLGAEISAAVGFDA